jgi:hypothetical protein
MSPANWAALIVSVITIVTGFSAAVRWLVKVLPLLRFLSST